MLRLNTLSNHFTASQESTKPYTNLLEKYRRMSDLDPEFIRGFNYSEVGIHNVEKFRHIMRDKAIFEPLSNEEDSRDVLREKINTRILKLLKEAKKVAPLSEIFNDFSLYCAFTTNI